MKKQLLCLGMFLLVVGVGITVNASQQDELMSNGVMDVMHSSIVGLEESTLNVDSQLISLTNEDISESEGLEFLEGSSVTGTDISVAELEVIEAKKEIIAEVNAELAVLDGDKDGSLFGTWLSSDSSAVESDGSQVPEPGLMFLFGAGLISFVGAGVVRKNK